MRFRGKVAVVTGGASGIGEATSRALLAEGARVCIGDVNEEALSSTLRKLQGRGLPVTGIAADVALEDDVHRLMEHAASSLGGLDLLVNNAGISPKHEGKKANLWEMSLEEWDRVMAVNIRGTFLCCREAVPLMINRGGGAIVNLSSLAAKAGSAITGSHYVASKAAVVGLTKVLAREVANYGIRVNAVAPGRIDTPMIWDVPPEVNERYKQAIPLGRLGSAEEVAEGILFLLSDAASYITGQVMDINGGLGMYY